MRRVGAAKKLGHACGRLVHLARFMLQRLFSRRRPTNGLAFAVRKLVTKEDPFMVHKVAGLFALCSFVYRYAVALPRTGTTAHRPRAASAGGRE